MELRWIERANEWWTWQPLDYILPWVTYFGSHIAVFVFIILVWILTRNKKILEKLMILYGIQCGGVYGIKFVIARQRPFLFLNRLSFSRGPGEVLDPSFPSAHAVFAFMMATLLSIWFPRYRILFYVFAGFIGWTRIYLGLHYPTDVIAGALLGYGVTKLFSSISPLNVKDRVRS